MWSVSEEWKVQCLNRKISGYSESDKTGMACLASMDLRNTVQDSHECPGPGPPERMACLQRKLAKLDKQHHVTGPALYCPLLADVLAELVGVTCWRKTLRCYKLLCGDLWNFCLALLYGRVHGVGTQYKPSSHMTHWQDESFYL